MPTYDYVCDGCGHAFELVQPMTAEPVKTCPECKKKKLRRLIGAGAALVFKGSGFYKTDYRSESYKKGAAADSGGDAKPSGKDGGGAKGPPAADGGGTKPAPAGD